MDELSHLPCFPSQAVPDHMSEFEEVLLQAFKDAYASEHAEHKAIAAYLTMFKVRAKQHACRPSRHEGGHCISGFEAAWVHTGNVALACVLVHVLVLGSWFLVLRSWVLLSRSWFFIRNLCLAPDPWF